MEAFSMDAMIIFSENMVSLIENHIDERGIQESGQMILIQRSCEGINHQFSRSLSKNST